MPAARRQRWAVLALLTLTLGVALQVPATSAPLGATDPEPIPVGGLTYADGAGEPTWGLQPHAAWSTRVVKRRYAVGTVIGYRSSSSSDHGTRLAADFMVAWGSEKGDRIASFAKRHFRQLNVTYVIWNHRIWSVERAAEGWRPMSDRGSSTANHEDHVHVSFQATPRDDTYRG